MEKKSFVIDTSVILDSPNNIISLYQNGENELYITDIILKELNKHKEDPQGEKGFYARAFARSLDRGLAKRNTNNISAKKRKGGVKKKNQLAKEETVLGDDIKQSFTCIFDGCEYPILINIISRKKYQQDSFTNDLKIIEVARDYNYEIVSNDIYLKLEALARGVEANSMNKDTVQNPEDISFDTTIILDNPEDENNQKIINKELELLNPWNQVKIIYKNSAKRDYFIVKGNDEDGKELKEMNIKEIEKQYKVPPINEEQKFYTEILSSKDFQIGVVTGSTGSGKTLMAVQEGIERVKDKYDPIDGIVYLRNTVTSNDKAAEMGFRKGDQDQKLGYFAYPLYGALNFIKERTISKEKTSLHEKQEEVATPNKEEYTDKMIEEYNIEVMDIAHARGITITNKFVIFDEVQNASNATVKLIGTRIGKGSKIVLMGDFKQVDHPYLSRNRNGLVYLLQRAKQKGDIAAIQLRKTIRSEIAEWFDANL